MLLSAGIAWHMGKRSFSAAQSFFLRRGKAVLLSAMVFFSPHINHEGG